MFKRIEKLEQRSEKKADFRRLVINEDGRYWIIIKGEYSTIVIPHNGRDESAIMQEPQTI